MVNLDKLIDHKDPEASSDFVPEDEVQLTINEDHNLIDSNQSIDKEEVSHSIISNKDIESKNETLDLKNTNSMKNEEETDIEIDKNQQEIDDTVIRESSLTNCLTENDLSLYQSNNHHEDQQNGIKNENNSFYFLDLQFAKDAKSNLIFEQLRDLYFEKQLLDCTIVCEEQCIRAHKLILAAVSPYFRSIFNSFDNNGCTNTAVVLQNIPASDMKLIIKIIYRVSGNIIKLSLNRATSLRESAYRLKIDFINDQLDSIGVPQLNKELINNLNCEIDLKINRNKNSRKRKRSFEENKSSIDRLNSSHDSSLSDFNQIKQKNYLSSSESSDESSASMKHHKYKHRYLLSSEHLEQNDSIVKCGFNLPPTTEQLNDEISDEDQQNEDDIGFEENVNDENSSKHKNDSIKSSSPSSVQNDDNENDSILTNNENLLNLAQKNSKSGNRLNEEKVIDFSLTKQTNNQDEILKLVNNAINQNSDNTDKVDNLYKAMKSEYKKLWTGGNDLNSDENFSNHLNNQLNNHFLNSTFSQLCMASANLNPDTARALLFTNELLKNNSINNNSQLHNSMNKNSTENSLNTSISSTNSSIGNVKPSSSNNVATAALVAAQQHLLNTNFLNNSSSNNVSKSNSLNNVLLNKSKSNNNLSSITNGSSNSSHSSSLSSSNGPVKRGRGRPPRHTQPNGIETNSTNSENLLNKISSTKTTKPFSSSVNTSLTLGNNLSSLNCSTTASSIVESLNAFNNQQNKWRPNLENLLALKMHKNKLNSTSPNTSSPTNDLMYTSSNSFNNSQANLANSNSSKGSTPNSSAALNHYSQNSNSSKINSTNSVNSTNNLNGSSSSSSTNNNSSSDGKQQNMCPYCPQVYYSNQAMNDHINNVHTKSAFKYTCELCSKEFSWKISLTKHIKHAHSDLSSPFDRSINNLGLNGLTNSISNNFGASTNPLSNQELLHSFMNRDNESAAMLNFSAIGE